MSADTAYNDCQKEYMPFSRSKCSGRKRTFEVINSCEEEEDSDSDIEIIPCKQKRKTINDDCVTTIKSKITDFLLWLKPKPMFQNFVSSALKSLGYQENIREEIELDVMSGKYTHHKDSPFPITKFPHSFDKPDRFITLRHKIYRTNLPDTDTEPSKENQPVQKPIPGALFKSKIVNPPLVNVPQKWSLQRQHVNGFGNSHSHRYTSTPLPNVQKSPEKITKESSSNFKKIVDNSQGRVKLSRLKMPPDVQFLKECPASDVLRSRTKLVLSSQNGVNGHSEKTILNEPTGFTTNEVVNKHEKEIYQMLLESYFNEGTWEPKLKVAMRNSSTQVNLDDKDVYEDPKKVDMSKYIEKYQTKSSSFVRRTCLEKPKPVASRPIFKPAPPEEDVLLLDDDEPFVFKEPVRKPISLPNVTGTSSFFSHQWVQDLRKSVEEETVERLKIVEEQRRQIEMCQKKRREKLALSALVLDESVIYEKEISDLPELTPEMDQVIDDALIPTPENEVLSKLDTHQVMRKDLDTLNSTNWLNDEVINFYLSLIVERSKLPGYPKVFTFNSFFFPSYKTKGYSAVRRWTRKVDIFSYDIILVPLHLEVHWCLAVIDFRNKTIRYYDSMSGKENCLNVLKDYLVLECRDKKKTEFDLVGWSLDVMKNIPPQMNGFDCGMFTLKYAEYITRDSAITFNQQNMKYFRRKMVYEIITQKIL